MTEAPVVPSRDDPFVRGGAGALGGPLGKRASAGHGYRTPLRVLLLLTLVTTMFGFWQKEPCLSHAWTHEYQYTRLCYSDIYALYYSEGLDKGKVPYASSPVEYPVLIGGMMAGAAWVVQEFMAPQDAGTWFFAVTAAGLGVCALVVVVTTVQLAGRRPWDAAMVAVAPVLLLHAFTNWDLLAAALTGAAMVAWAKRHPVLAGVLVGLGISAKLYPVLLLAALLPLCARTRLWAPWLRATAAAVVTWLLVNLPVVLLWPHSWWQFYRLNNQRPADWDSLWFQLGDLTSGARSGVGGVLHRVFAPTLAAGQSPSALNMLSLAGFVVLWLAIAVLAYRAPRRPRVAQVAFLVVLAFLLVNKVWSPQYAIWYLPLAVLALPRWRPVIAWQAAEVVVLFTRYYYFVHYDTGSQGIEVGWFYAAVLIRDALLLLIAALVVRDILRPAHDRVRRSGMDDPAGGPLDGAADRVRAALPESSADQWQPTPA